MANTGGSGVTVRAEPGSQAAAMLTLRDGTRLNLTGQEQTVAARLWREVEVPDRGQTGWVSSEYLTLQP
ncbi:MAG: SH3 domain-containing protein [Chloroflexi bacterium]|nr:SH3 domain-containing protein [Chloroflexota bacterium]